MDLKTFSNLAANDESTLMVQKRFMCTNRGGLAGTCRRDVCLRKHRRFGRLLAKLLSRVARMAKKTERNQQESQFTTSNNSQLGKQPVLSCTADSIPNSQLGIECEAPFSRGSL